MSANQNSTLPGFNFDVPGQHLQARPEFVKVNVAERNEPEGPEFRSSPEYLIERILGCADQTLGRNKCLSDETSMQKYQNSDMCPNLTL
jgi:hypothetical protein